VARLVLALIEFLRKLLERQAIRRWSGTLTPRRPRPSASPHALEETVHDWRGGFGLDPADLNWTSVRWPLI